MKLINAVSMSLITVGLFFIQGTSSAANFTNNNDVDLNQAYNILVKGDSNPKIKPVVASSRKTPQKYKALQIAKKANK